MFRAGFKNRTQDRLADAIISLHSINKSRNSSNVMPLISELAAFEVVELEAIFLASRWYRPMVRICFTEMIFGDIRDDGSAYSTIESLLTVNKRMCDRRVFLDDESPTCSCCPLLIRHQGNVLPKLKEKPL